MEFGIDESSACLSRSWIHNSYQSNRLW